MRHTYSVSVQPEYHTFFISHMKINEVSYPLSIRLLGQEDAIGHCLFDTEAPLLAVLLDCLSPLTYLEWTNGFSTCDKRTSAYHRRVSQTGVSLPHLP